MLRGAHAQNTPADVSQLIEQLERHCLASDGSYVSKSSYSELQLAREEMFKERTLYLEALAVYCEAIGMVEEYQHAVTAAKHGGDRDQHALYPQFGLTCSSQVYESLEHQLAVAEAAQRLRLPLLSKDGDIHGDEIEKSNTMSRSSFGSASSITLSSGSYSTGYNRNYADNSTVSRNFTPPNISVNAELGVGGVSNRFLGVTPSFLWQLHSQQITMAVNSAEYQRSVVAEIESHLEAKCDTLADIFTMDDTDSSSLSQISGARLPERVKLIIEEIEKEEALLLEDLYSMDRKFAEHFNVLEQILEVLVKFVKDLKLKHQHEYDELRKTWLCKRCQTMNAKLRVLEHLLLRDTYTKESVPALHRIRNYLTEATEEASNAYNKAVTRLREYQGVDPHFDSIARQYHEIVTKLNETQWTIHQIEMDLKSSHDKSAK